LSLNFNTLRDLLLPVKLSRGTIGDQDRHVAGNNARELSQNGSVKLRSVMCITLNYFSLPCPNHCSSLALPT
jgi:hypothetical protein